MTELLTVSPLIQAAGYALVAFLWQGAAIGIVALLLAALSRRATADTRYLLGCVTLAALMLTPLVTLARHVDDTSGPARQEISTRLSAPATGGSSSSVEASRAVHEDARPLADSRFSIVVTVWALGVVVFGLHLLRGGVLVRRLRGAASPLAAADQLETLRRLATRLGLAQQVQLFESWSIDVPAVIGWLRPAIVVPVSALAGLSPSYFEAILAHELAHVRRRDYLVNIVQRIVETLLFYHPAVWWVSSWIRREREHCCDDIAAAACGDRVGYARALHALEELRADAPALAMGARGGHLLVRMKRLVYRTPVPAPGWPGGIAMIVPLVAFLTVGSIAGGPSVSALPLPAVEARPIVILAPAGAAPVTVGELPAMASHNAIAPPKRAANGPATQAGSVAGTVRDPVDGVIPGATVTLRSQTTSEAKTAVTAATGSFMFSDLVPGDYDLEVSLSGFKRSPSVVHVGAGQQVTPTVRLQLGSLAEEMMVTGILGEARNPSSQLPAGLQTATDYREAARFYYDREDFGNADQMMNRAIEIIRASQPPRPQPSVQTIPGWVVVGGSIREPRKTYDVHPIYPSGALAAGVEGTVVMAAIVARDGTVADARITSASSAFDDAAIGAVRQWMFTPTLLNGIPVEVMMSVTVTFKMR